MPSSGYIELELNTLEIRVDGGEHTAEFLRRHLAESTEALSDDIMDAVTAVLSEYISAPFTVRVVQPVPPVVPVVREVRTIPF